MPFCGDYQEAGAWSADETGMYRRFLDKRLKMQEEESKNIAEYLLR